ncbi:MAG: glycosyltransferase family 2 protein [Okeania sp. SIO2G5]|nr:glycosyltransferase family 2 protein [Okeania sp. SIO2G5]NEP76675.1 glycosyltransferase family 2 protein [Okeania sp. SIO2G5]
MLNSICVIIPVRNEEEAISDVIASLQSHGLHSIRVVDNGSGDRSAQRARAAGAEVIWEPTPGYGQACWTGLQHLPASTEWILFCDGDGSDDPNDIPALLDRILQNQPTPDFVVGDRRATPSGQAAMTPVQNFGNALATTLMHWGWGRKYHDLGPLRLIRRSALDAIQMQDRGFGWTVEMQIRAVELGLIIQELPVNYRPRQGGQSKISGTIRGSIQAGTIILKTVGQLYLQRFIRAQWGHKRRQ